MTTITIDMRMIHHSGIGTYLKNIVPIIVGNCSEYHFYLLGPSSKLESLHELKNKSNVTILECNSPIYSIAEQMELVKKIPNKTSLFWSPHINIPVFYYGKLMVTVHDVFFLAMSKFVEGFSKKIYAKLMYHLIRRKADSIITVSEFTRNELLKYTGNWKEESIFPIHIGVNQFWFERLENSEAPRQKPYFLYVGNVKPHKNVKALIRAFQLIMENIEHDLVIVGKKEGFITEDREVNSMAESLKDRICFTGYIDDYLLKQYYAHAELMVLPSLYEGFGLPPIEAMASGCPVLVSNKASLPEVCGNAALYCDPTNHVDISEKMMELIRDKELRNAFIQKGFHLAQTYSWEKTAEQTISIMRRVLHS